MMRFSPITMTIKAAGGLPPDGRDMNQALNELYTGYRWHNAGAGYPFDADFATAIGGYPAGRKCPIPRMTVLAKYNRREYDQSGSVGCLRNRVGTRE